jgi:hypothetical protein
VLLTIPDQGLAELIASPSLLAQMWPGAVQDVMVLFHLLRMSRPSVAEALAIGLIQLLTPPAAVPMASLGLAYSRVILSAVARREDGELVAEPHARVSEIVWLEVTDVAVSGRSGIRLAG